MRKIASLCLLVCSFLVACGGDGGNPANPDAAPANPDAAPALPDAAPADAAVAPAFRNHVDKADDEIAYTALQLLGSPKAGGSHSCNDCHAQTRPLLVHWRDLADASMSQCLTDLAVSTPEKARAMLDCLRANPQDASSPFVTAKLGPYSAAAHLDWFRFVFQRAYGADWEAKYESFKLSVAMPKGAHQPFSQADFDIVAEWFARGLPFLDILPDNPPPAECTGQISPELATHVTAMKQSGWGALNAEHHVLMHGCAGAQDALGCLAAYPRASAKPYGTGWESLPGTKLRVLKETNYSSSYWTRSSADGRFIGHGGPDGHSSIIDLVADRVIPVAASFDPGFFPDNSGFIFQGPGFLCEQSVLTSSPAEVRPDLPGCTSSGDIGLYQHVGAALDGGDYWVVNGSFESDDGGKGPTLGDPAAYFSADSAATLTPMIHTGHAFQPGTPLSSAMAYEGDTVISPSSRLLISRLAGPGAVQRGYVLRKLVATPKPGGGYTIATPEIARYCTADGAKVNFSFDERWIVTHDYVEDKDAVDLGFSSASDPGFAAYRKKGAANIVIIDLLTGTRKRITRMQPGQYALYPHFRSDGWIYFLVRTLDSPGEIVVASDAALVLP